MYCRKCGKQIDYDSEFCRECKQALLSTPLPAVTPSIKIEEKLIVEQVEQPIQERRVGSRTKGLAKALTSTIVGTITFILAFIMYIVLSVIIGENNSGYDLAYYESIAFLVIMITAIASIPSLVLGIQSMSCFFKQNREGKVRPMATLVLGIVGVANNVLALLYATQSFLLI